MTLEGRVKSKPSENRSRCELGLRMSGHLVEQPMLTIITVCLNNDNNLERCIDSVLAEKKADDEYLIIDGGSHDKSWTIVEKHKTKIDYALSESDSGVYDAINKGIALARGQYILLVHADDFLARGALTSFRRALENKKAQIYMGDSLYVNSQGHYISYRPARDYKLEVLLRGIPAAHEALFIHKSVYDSIGLYDVSYKIVSDLKFVRNAALKEFVFERIGATTLYKLSDGSSFSADNVYRENYELMREIYPDLDEQHFRGLYSLKNYRHLNSKDLEGIYNLLASDKFRPPFLMMRAMTISLTAILNGDSVNTARKPSLKLITKVNKDENLAKTVMLCIGWIREIAGGAERVLIDLANHLANRGFKVIICSIDGRAGKPFYFLNENVEVIDLKEPPHSYQPSHAELLSLHDELDEILKKCPSDILDTCFRIANDDKQDASSSKSKVRSQNWHLTRFEEEKSQWIKRFGTSILQWRNALKRHSPHCVVPFMISAAPYVFIASRKVSIPCLISNHGNPVRDYYQSDDWSDLVIDRIFRFFSIAGAKSSHWLNHDFVAEMPPSCRKNAVVIPNAVATTPTKNDYRKKIILAVGRLVPVKNHKLVIEAFGKIKDIDEEWELHIYGSGPLKDELIGVADQCGVSRRFKLNDPVKDVSRIYSEASVFVQCSTTEGFSLSTAEALSSGIPCIGLASCSGVNRLIENDINGFLLRSRNFDEQVIEMTDKLVSLMKDENLRSSLGRKGRETSEMFSPGKVFQMWESLITREVFK